jgi:hypothetical protein
MKLIGYVYGINQTASKEITMGVSGCGDASLDSLTNYSGQRVISDAMKAQGKPCLFDIYASWGQSSLNTHLTDPFKSTALISKIAAILWANGFSGVSFDWECSNTSTITKAQYTDFFKRLYAKLNPLGKTISCVENDGTVTLLPEAANYLDWIGLMVYDVAPAATWYGTLQDVKDDTNHWLAAGFPKDKLLVGISCAARPTWSAWYAGQPYHDTPASAALKAKYVYEQGLGGVFLYHMGLDKLNDPGSIAAAVYKELFPVTPTPVPVPPPVPPPVPIPPITPSVVVSSQDIQVKDSTGKVLCTITVGVK